jgi:hypothetical protein
MMHFVADKDVMSSSPTAINSGSLHRGRQSVSENHTHVNGSILNIGSNNNIDRADSLQSLPSFLRSRNASTYFNNSSSPASRTARRNVPLATEEELRRVDAVVQEDPSSLLTLIPEVALSLEGFCLDHPDMCNEGKTADTFEVLLSVCHLFNQ